MTTHDRATRALRAYLSSLPERPTDEDTERAAALVELAQRAYTYCYDRASRDTVDSLRGWSWPDDHGDVK